MSTKHPPPHLFSFWPFKPFAFFGVFGASFSSDDDDCFTKLAAKQSAFLVVSRFSQ